MALTVGELQVQLEARTAEFKAGLKQAESRLTRFEKKAGTSATKAGKSFLGLKSILVGVVGVLSVMAAFRIGKAIISGAIEAAGAFEQFEARLQNFLGTQEAASKAVQDFTEIAAKTPFSVAQVVGAGATLGSLALANGEALNELTKQAVNLAAVTGLDLPQAANNLQRALSNGVASADLFRERGVTPLLEAVLGIPDATKLSVAETRVAFDQLVGTGGIFEQAAENLSFTLTGALSNVGDATEVLQAQLGSAFAPAVVAGARKFLIPLLETLQEVVVDNKDAILDFAFSAIGSLITGFATMIRVTQDLLGGLAFLVEGFLDAKAGVLRFLAVFLKFTPAGIALRLTLGLTTEALDEMVASSQKASNEGATTLRGLQNGAKVAADAAENLAIQFGNLDIEKFAKDQKEAQRASDKLAAALAAARDKASAAAKATTAQANALKKLQGIQQKRQLDRLREVNPLLAERQEIENQIKALRALDVNEEGRVLRNQVIKQLLADQQELTRRIAEGDFEVSDLSDTVAGAVSMGFAQAVRGEGDGGGIGAIGAALQARAQESLTEAFETSLKEFELSFSKILDGLGKKISGLFQEDGALSGLGDAFGGILKNPKFVQGVLGVGGAILQGLGGADVQSAASSVTSAVTSSQQVRGVVAGPTSIAIGEVQRGIQQANKELERQGLIQIRQLESIEQNTRGAGSGAPSPNDPAEVALSTESESLT